MTDDFAELMLTNLAKIASDPINSLQGWARDLFIKIVETAGLVVIPKATAGSIDDAHRRLSIGLPVSSNEIQSILYAVAACSPDGRQRRVYA
jgi:hypothetical protein